MLLHKSQQRLQPQVNGVRVNSSVYGQTIPILYGMDRCSTRLIATKNFQTHNQSGGLSGGSGGKGGNQTTYSTDADMLTCYGPMETCGAVWSNQTRYVGIMGSQTFVLGAGTSFPLTVTSPYGPVAGIIAVGLHESVSQTYTDYGAPSPFTVSVTDEIPLYNSTSPLPNSGNITGAGIPYWTGNATPNNPALTVVFPGGTTGATVTVYFFYSGGLSQGPLTAFGLDFERELGTGYAGITYPEFSGFSGQNIDMGMINVIPQYNFEVKGLYGIGPEGDCNLADVIIDIICSGDNPTLYGTNACWYHGLGLNNLPAYISAGGNNLTYSRFGGILKDEPDIALGGNNLGLNAVRNYLQSYGIWASLCIEAQQSAAQLLEDICKIANCAPVWDGASLDFIPYCEVSNYGRGLSYVAPTAGGPVFALTDDHFIVKDRTKPAAPVTIINNRPDDLYNSLPIDYIDRKAGTDPTKLHGDGNYYNHNTITVTDNPSVIIQGPLPGTTLSLPWIKDPNVAIAVGQAILKRNRMINGRRIKFDLPASLSWLTPMDLVTVFEPAYSPDTPLPVRIIHIEDAEDYGMTVEAEPFIYGASQPIANGLAPQAISNPAISPSVDPGTVNAPVIFETIPAISNVPQIWICASGQAEFYGGCVVYLSTDGGTTYNPVGTIIGRQSQGLVYSSNFPNHPDPDTVNTLNVDLSESLGVLNTFTTTQRDAFQSLCWLEGGGTTTVNGVTLTIPYELIAYATANLSAANKYAIPPTIRRGVYGTPTAAHNIGSKFSFLKDGLVFALDVDPKWVGQTLHFKFQAFNAFNSELEDLSTVTDYPFAVTGLTGWSYTDTGSNPPPTTVPYPTGSPNPSLLMLYIVPYFAGDGVSPLGSETLLEHVVSGNLTSMTLPAGLAGSAAGCRTAPASAVTITINKNGSSIGTINIAGGATAATFAFATAVTFSPGDIITFVMQSAPDTSLTGLYWTLAGTRT